MKKLVALLVALVAIVAPIIYSDSATMSVNVGTTNPTVDNIVIAGQDTSAAVSPSAGTTVSVSISAEASDNNGHGDISTVICTISGPGTVQDSPVGLSAGSIVDSTTRTYTGSFNMDFYDAAGTYTVDCEATDSSAGTGSRQENFDYNSLTALELDANTIAFGNMDPGSTVTVSGDSSMGTDSAPTIQNYGNVQIDAQTSGTDLDDGGSNTIDVGEVDYQYGILGWDALSTTPTTESTLNLAAGLTSTRDLDVRLGVPIGTVPASYSGTITITAIAG